MKNNLVGLFLIFAASGLVQGQPRASKGLEQELMRLQKAQDDAEGAKDVAALDRLLSPDFLFTAPGGATTDKKKFLLDVKNSGDEGGQTLAYEEVRSQAYGNTAVVNYRFVVKGKGKDGAEISSRYRNTVVWVKQQGTWRMVAIHVSRIRP